ncbi:Uncharacterised protein [Mycobacteroides abscessus subsp. abscessus]|nr:Uncharacterised protein [Mycobacteroides abscessus subsp. abscessus]
MTETCETKPLKVAFDECPRKPGHMPLARRPSSRVISREASRLAMS